MVEKIYSPDTIENNPLPEQIDVPQFTDAQTSTGGVNTQGSIPDQRIARKRVSRETIASSLNTKSKKILGEFTFTDGGAIRVGEYTPGVSGDLRITPNGLTARNESGITTFAIDGTTGDAVFKGELQAGGIITGDILVTGGGSITAKDGDESSVLDAYGLVSTTNFKYGTVTSETNQSTTSGTFSVLNSMTLTTPNFPRSVVVNILFSVINQLYGNDANSYSGFVQYLAYIDGSNQPDMYLTRNADFDSVSGEKQGLTLTTNTIHFLQEMSAGTHTIEIKWRVFNSIGAGVANAYRRTLSFTSLGN